MMPEAMSGVTPKAPERKPRILVVEDDAQIREMLQKILSKDYAVVTAADGKQALVLAAKSKPDLLMLDVMLPEIDGFDLAAKVRATEGLKKVPIIFLTARDTARDTIKGIQVGAKHYITKPFNIKDVLAKVAKILG
jgi:two-component system OmpR family response regulator